MLTCGRADVLTCLRAVAWGTVAAVMLLIAGCQSAPEDPEAQIRALIDKAEKAAEEKDVGTLKSLISESYAGGDPKDKRGLVGLIGYFMLRNSSIHLLTQVSSIEFPQPKQAECTVYVAMAGRAIGGLGDLSDLRADIYRIEFAAAAEGSPDWRVTRAKWKPAGIEDLEAAGEE